MLIPAWARVEAARTLTDECTITRSGADTAVDGVLAAGAATTVAAGPCSLSPPSSQDRSPSGGGDRLIGSRTLRLSPEMAGIDAVRPGDRVAVSSHPGVLVVHSIDDRTTEVLRRVTVVDVVDARPVPT